MEKDRPETASWDTHAFFDELHHNLLLYVKQPYDPAPLARVVQESCEKYGKELHIRDDEAKSPFTTMIRNLSDEQD